MEWGALSPALLASSLRSPATPPIPHQEAELGRLGLPASLFTQQGTFKLRDTRCQHRRVRIRCFRMGGGGGLCMGSQGGVAWRLFERAVASSGLGLVSLAGRSGLVLLL